MTGQQTPNPAIARIIDDFAYVDDWEERYKYLIELGKELPPLPDEARTAANKVQGCVSQVWIDTRRKDGPDGPVLDFIGDSDALIVRGLVAIVLALYSGRPAREIAATDAAPVFAQLGLDSHLTPQRSNGLAAMVKRIRADAERALTPQA